MNFNKEIIVGSKVISQNNHVFIIAEAGVNHNGKMDFAKSLIDIAVAAGVDAVKFQTFKTENLIVPNVVKAPYQLKTTDNSETQFDMLKKLEITREQNLELSAYCKEKKIIFLTTPYDEDSLDSLDELDLPAYKIASTDLTNLPFIIKVAKKGKPIFLSTGMSYMSEIELALQEIHPFNKDVILLQCTANYPIQDAEANLNVINTYKSIFDGLIGYSDHSVGIGAAPYAVPMGAIVIEKHFTLDKDQQGPDHLASLDPNELKELVKVIRKVESFMGTYVKLPSLDEIKTRKSLQKSLVARVPIIEGSVFNEMSFVAKRTGGDGINPIYFRSLIGKTAKKSYKINDIISE